ncbi:cyclin-D1-binding protein 1 homolog [Lingula anatina]|uniref:Cyclin-D1-binding protein 1 homolog n=1 Tax=Lingula anatina TaxID=7574 RepID=A0A1S3JAV2_LINAN|nr:cyclin-D1-binding protein 1 homolog [Lingula anatina]|eukprot:XP_013407453.1 cyclin-D1-binding protein 1 homolog [Lingula anatina]
MSTSGKSVKEVLQAFLENLDLVIDQLRKGESTRADTGDFQVDKYWTHLGAVVKAVSHECTKLCIAFSTPPLPAPEECSGLVSGLERATLALVSAFYSLPTSQGLTLWKSSVDAVCDIIEGVQELVRRIAQAEIAGSADQLQSTGKVWESCNGIKDTPKDNKAAVITVVTGAGNLVKDALEELEAAVENEGRLDYLDLGDDDSDDLEEETWSEADKRTIAPCIGLVKAVKACLKKTSVAVRSNGECVTVAQITELDKLADVMRLTSPAVDNFVSGLYAPLDLEMAKDNARKLADIVLELLELSKTSHVTFDEDIQWITFLKNAIQHNLEKIQNPVNL